jgi:CheY-like chemotaxis protein
MELGKKVMTGLNKSKAVSILIIDDDDVDVMALKRAFKKVGVSNPIYVAGDGVEGLEVLRGQNGHEKVVAPVMILLDLNMPRMGGLEFLEELRSDAEFKCSIVFVLTTSAAEEDRLQAYDHHVSGYILKSDATSPFLDAVSMLDNFARVIEFPES